MLEYQLIKELCFLNKVVAYCLELEYHYQGCFDWRLVQYSWRDWSILSNTWVLIGQGGNQLPGRQGTCSTNTIVVCVIRLLLSSTAAAAVDLLIAQKGLVASIAVTTCPSYNQIRKERKMCITCMQSFFSTASCTSNRERQCQVNVIVDTISLGQYQEKPADKWHLKLLCTHLVYVCAVFLAWRFFCDW